MSNTTQSAPAAKLPIVAHLPANHGSSCASLRWAYMLPYECDCGARDEPLVRLSDALAALAKVSS